VVGALRRSPTLTLRALGSCTGLPDDRLTDAVGSLARDGLLVASPAAVAGRPGARVRLAD
jgi:hypothetical protein